MRYWLKLGIAIPVICAASIGLGHKLLLLTGNWLLAAAALILVVGAMAIPLFLKCD